MELTKVKLIENHPITITPVINNVEISEAHIDAHFCPSLKITNLTVQSSL
jgi:hypothetical protein